MSKVITPAKLFKVTVRDTHCGIKGRFEEEVEVHTENEAKSWAKQFRSEYPADAGYVTKIEAIENPQPIVTEKPFKKAGPYQVTILLDDIELACSEAEDVDFAISDACVQIPAAYNGMKLKASILTPAGARTEMNVTPFN